MALLRARQRAEAVAARKAEIRRRRENAARLVEVGLGSQLRFAGAVDALGLEGDEEEEEEEDFDEAAGDDLPPPLTIGFVGYPNVGERRAVLDSRLSREVVAQAESLTALQRRKVEHDQRASWGHCVQSRCEACCCRIDTWQDEALPNAVAFGRTYALRLPWTRLPFVCRHSRGAGGKRGTAYRPNAGLRL